MITFSSFIPFTLSAACYVLGYAAGVWAFFAMARSRGLATPGILALLASGLIGGLVGAYAGQWLAGGADGKSILGAVAGGYLGVFLHKRYLGIVRPTGDLFAVAMSAGEAVGRWGCFFGGCCYGHPTHAPWAVWQHGAYRHPSQIYLSLAAALVLAVLLRVNRNRPPENTLFFLQGVLFCAARFAIEFFRDVPTGPLGLSAAQWACLGGLVFFGIGLARVRRIRGDVSAGRMVPRLEAGRKPVTHANLP